MRIIYFYLVILFGSFSLLVFNFSCASITPLTGGKRDSIPPKLIATKPVQYATHVSSKQKKFILQFDENINLKDEKKIKYEPKVSGDPSVYFNRNFIKIKLKDTLRKNTTYNFSFGDAIRDLNEANVLGNFTYRFTTGASFDSCYINGYVFQSENLLPEAKISVGLYFAKNVENDSFVYKEKPDYLTQTDDSGYFKFNLLPYDSFYIVAIKDEDFNGYYSNPTERFAFLTKQIITPYLNQTTSPYQVFAQEDTSMLEQMDKKNIDTFQDELSYIIELNKYLDSVYKERVLQDKLLAEKKKEVEVIDTILRFGNQSFLSKIQDSSYIILYTYQKKKNIEKKANSQPGGKVKKKYTTNLIGGNQLILNSQLSIFFPNKEYMLSEDNILLLDGKKKVTLFFNNFIKKGQALVLNYPFKVGKNYTLLVDTVQNRDVAEYLFRDYDTIPFTVITKENLANIQVHVPNYKKSNNKIVLRLMVNDKVVDSQMINDTQIVFDQILPNTYGFELLVDYIPNLIFNTGDYDAGIVPELILPSKSTIAQKEFTVEQKEKKKQEKDMVLEDSSKEISIKPNQTNTDNDEEKDDGQKNIPKVIVRRVLYIPEILFTLK